MGQKQSAHAEALQNVREEAAKRVGDVAISARFNRLPKRLEDDYEINENSVLGTGYNGSVFLCTNKSGPKRKYAVKGFHMQGISADKLQQLEAECMIFLSMDHPHVARLVDVYECDRMLNLVMECMEGGELFERLTDRKRFTEPDAAMAVWQMLLAVNYLHSRGVVHRDLKLENFLYESKDTDHLKLIDFGFSHVWEPNTTMALSCGTLAYVAPEVLKKSYTSKCDLWSTGVILFILLAGYMPFSGAEKKQRTAIDKGEYNWRPERWAKVSPEAQDLVKKLLVKDAEQRLSAEDALKHKFINKRHDVQDAARPGSPRDQMEGLGDALVSFAKASQFRRACMSVMAWSLTNEERAKVREMFIAMDKNNTGTITMCELRDILMNKFEISDDQVKPIFAALDTAQNDEIHYSEFLAAMCSTRIAMHDELLRQTFSRFDADNTGFISVDNLRTVLGDSFSGAEVEKLIQEADTTKDGKISYDEFIAYLKSGDDDDQGGEKTHAMEAAEKIIENALTHEEAAKAAAAPGTLQWCKGKAKGMVEKTGAGVSSMTGSMKVNTGASRDTQGSGGATAAAPAQGAENQPLVDKKGDQKGEKSSGCCTLQ